MVVINVKNVLIDFPYEPYSCQLVYMEKVIECLQNGKNGALESPTGTGKTLCLLCACLGWLESEREKIRSKPSVAINPNLLADALNIFLPKIIYTSRTHSQLSQVVKELNKTIYKTKVKVCIFGSRDQLCINEQVRNEENSSVKNNLCRAKVQSRSCSFHWGLDGTSNKSEFRLGQVLDIEEFVTLGRKHKFCPFYKARENQDEADLILMPYNYILEPRSRKANKIELRNNIIIFDEAHNLEKICEDSASVTFGSRDLVGCLKETKETLNRLLADEENVRKSMDETTVAFGKGKENDSSSSALDTKQLAHLLLLLDAFEKEMDLIDIEQLNNNGNDAKLPGKVMPGSYVFELLDKSGISPQMRDSILLLLDQMMTYLAQNENNSLWQSKGIYLQKLSSFLGTVFAKDDIHETRSGVQCYEKQSKMFKVFVQKEEAKKEIGQLKFTKSAKTNSGVVLNYWCFSAGLSMTALQEKGIRCVIVTSGTLSPLQHFINEMKIPFEVTLENNHVVEAKQVSFNIIRKGPDGQPLLATFNNRNNTKYLSSLANTLINLFRVVPQGILVFFASYPQMQSCLDFWKSSDTFDKMYQLKRIFVEPKKKDLFRQCLSDFTSVVNDSKLKGAAFFGVCRGKISEGVDFADNAGRAVVLVGVPYPPLMDPRVVLKKAFLNEQNSKQINGNSWYETEAIRAANQALGRVIRHRNDFGAIIVADERFCNWQRCFPKWLQLFIGSYNEFGVAIKNISSFFKLHRLDSNLALSTSSLIAAGTVQLSKTDLDLKRKLYGLPTAQTIDGMNSAALDSFQFTELKSTYACDKDLVITCSKPSSALDLLDVASISTLSVQKPTSFSFPSRSHSEFTNGEVKRKRIKIKMNAGSNDAEMQPNKAAKVALTNSTRYASAVKEFLPKDQFVDFITLCKDYKTDKNYEKIVHELKRMFLISNRIDLFKGFETFLSSEHRSQFAQDFSSF